MAEKNWLDEPYVRVVGDERELLANELNAYVTTRRDVVEAIFKERRRVAERISTETPKYRIIQSEQTFEYIIQAAGSNTYANYHNAVLGPLCQYGRLSDDVEYDINILESALTQLRADLECPFENLLPFVVWYPIKCAPCKTKAKAEKELAKYIKNRTRVPEEPEYYTGPPLRKIENYTGLPLRKIEIC